jgi:DNA-binding SARP family transcriptional activator
MIPLRINLLGQPQIQKSNGESVDVTSKKSAGILYYLSLSKTPMIRREVLLPLFWMDRSVSQAKSSLKVALTQLRRALNIDDQTVLLSDRTYVGINEDIVWVDVKEIDSLSATDSPQRWRQIFELYNGDFLEGFSIPNEANFAKWCKTERIALRSTFGYSLEQLSKNTSDEREAKLVISMSHRMLQFNSTDEVAHRSIMNVYANQKKYSMVVDQYNTCCAAIRDTRGIAPDEETTQLLNDIHNSANNVRGPVYLSAPAEQEPESNGRISILVSPHIEDDNLARHFNASFSSELVAALSRFKWIEVRRKPRGLVTDDTSVVEFSALECKPPKYELTWAARMRDNSIRVLIEVLELKSGSVVWAEGFESEVCGNLDYDDIIISKITSSIDGQLRKHELQNIIKKDVRDLGAHGKVLKAINLMHELTADRFREARTLLHEALNLDPTYSTAYTWWAFWEIFNIGQGWKIENDDSNLSARDIALEAIKLDPNDSLALVIAGHFDAFIERNLDQAIERIQQSLELNPNSSFALMLGSNTYSYMGNPRRALQMLDRSQELCPIEPYYGWMYHTSRCIAYTFAREYRTAVDWGRRSVRSWPKFSNGYKPLIASLGHLNQFEEAGEYLLRLQEMEPEFTIQSFVKTYPFALESDRDNYAEGLRLAGVPD